MIPSMLAGGFLTGHADGFPDWPGTSVKFAVESVGGAGWVS
jgi:hypothetical protein